MTRRHGKTGKGSHTYECGGYYVTRMGNDEWTLFTGHSGTGKHINHYFRTLRAARAWCVRNPFPQTLGDVLDTVKAKLDGVVKWK